MKLNEKSEELIFKHEDSEENPSDKYFEVQQEDLTSQDQNPLPQVTTDSLDDTDLQRVLKELSELRFPPLSDDDNANSGSKVTVKKQHIRLNGIQLIYQFLVWMMSIATTLVSPTQNNVAENSGEAKIRKAQTAANIFFLYALPKKR
ncbi:hypothetical protein PMKS-003758 [Pichia membranifaciens]|uniref:Uncharacterized protein n=1 Tax=Pichia membranifaciens TaxID=4926 RepID=A0A1Q2YL24_9ASCO|nr:hypothetical protein PMKS-003758 [Pichia membranifaciens]